MAPGGSSWPTPRGTSSVLVENPAAVAVPVRIEIKAVTGAQVQLPLNVWFGVQRTKHLEQEVRATVDGAQFDVAMNLFAEHDGFDARGPYVHGKKGDRFFYLVWAEPDQDSTLTMFARSKFMLNDVDASTLRSALEGSSLICSVDYAAEDKGPFGTIRPPRVTWLSA